MNLIKLFLQFNSIIEFNQNNELFAYIMPNTGSQEGSDNDNGNGYIIKSYEQGKNWAKTNS